MIGGYVSHSGQAVQIHLVSYPLPLEKPCFQELKFLHPRRNPDFHHSTSLMSLPQPFKIVIIQPTHAVVRESGKGRNSCVRIDEKTDIKEGEGAYQSHGPEINAKNRAHML